MIIIGGLDDLQRPLNDINSLDLSKNIWTSHQISEELKKLPKDQSYVSTKP